MSPPPLLAAALCIGLCTAASAGPALEVRDALDGMHTLADYAQWRATPPGEFAQEMYSRASQDRLAERAAATAPHDGGDTAYWKARRDEVRRLLHETTFAGLPETAAHERRPPTSVLTGQEKRYAGLNLTVHTLTIEPTKGDVMPCALFVPDADGPLPGVLFASGHAPDAFRSTAHNYQRVILNVALKGAVVLACDPRSQGERFQYADPETGESAIDECGFTAPAGDGQCATTGGSCTSPHGYAGRQLFLAGASAASLWAWDGVRALDYLESLPEVDAGNLGMTGCSGGGTLTAYVAATDERVKAASIACYMSTFENDLKWEGTEDSEQVWLGGIAAGLDKPDLLVARAPLATHVCLTTNDGVFPMQGGLDAVADAAPAFEALGGVLTTSHDYGPHGWADANIRATVDFFAEELGSAPLADGEPLSDASLPCADLVVTATGQVASDPAYPHARFLPDLVRDLADERRARRAAERRRAGPGDFWAQTLELAADVAVRLAAEPPAAVFVGSQQASGMTVERWVIPGPDPCVATVDLYAPAGAATYPVATYLSARIRRDGPPGELGAALIDALVPDGVGVAVLSVCGLGMAGGGNAFDGDHDERDEPHRSGWGNYHLEFLPLPMNTSHVGLHAGDVLRAQRWLRGRPEVDFARSSVVAGDDLGAAVLHAAAASPEDVPSVAILSSTASYDSVARSEFYGLPRYALLPFVLERYDLPDLMAAAACAGAGRRVLVASPRDAQGDRLLEVEAAAVYRDAVKCGGGAAVLFELSRDAGPQEVAEWVRAGAALG